MKPDDQFLKHKFDSRNWRYFMEQDIGLMKNGNMNNGFLRRMYTDIVETVKHIESDQFSYRRSAFFSVLFGVAGIGFLLTRKNFLFNIGGSVFFVAFFALIIVTFFCIFDFFSQRNLICSLTAGAKLEEDYKQLPKMFSKLLERKCHYREVIIYIGLGFCPIIGFSLYLIINIHSLFSLCSIVFCTIVALCLYAFSLRKFVSYFEKSINSKNEKVVK